MSAPGRIDPTTVRTNVGHFRGREATAYCPLCGAANTVRAYEGGQWQVTECKTCGVLWRPKEGDAA